MLSFDWLKEVFKVKIFIAPVYCHKYATFEVIVFMFSWPNFFFFKNIVASPLKSYLA